jgi:pilus assembly protein Flp/PilA
VNAEALNGSEYAERNEITVDLGLPLGRQFVANEQGATAIEYALLAAGVAAFIAATVFGFGADLKTTFYDRIAAML